MFSCLHVNKCHICQTFFDLPGPLWVVEVSWAQIHWGVHGWNWPGIGQRAAVWSQGEFLFSLKCNNVCSDDAVIERVISSFGLSGGCNLSLLFMFPQGFKRELYQKKIEIESLNHRFVCRLSPGSERPGSVSPLCDFRQRWDSLESETVGRQVGMSRVSLI